MQSGKYKFPIGGIMTGQFATTTVTATVTVDWNSGNVQSITLVSGANTLTFANPASGAQYILKLVQPSGGAAGTVTWPTIKWPGGVTPVLTSTNSGIDVFKFTYDGTSYLNTGFAPALA